MVFSSLNFLYIFFPATLAVYLLVPYRAKNIVLLIASIFFYAWGEPVYVVLMLLNIVFNYIAVLQFEASSDQPSRKRHLIIAVAVNLLLLGFFKYAGLFVSTVNSVPADRDLILYFPGPVICYRRIQRQGQRAA